MLYCASAPLLPPSLLDARGYATRWAEDGAYELSSAYGPLLGYGVCQRLGPRQHWTSRIAREHLKPPPTKNTSPSTNRAEILRSCVLDFRGVGDGLGRYPEALAALIRANTRRARERGAISGIEQLLPLPRDHLLHPPCHPTTKPSPKTTGKKTGKKKPSRDLKSPSGAL
eukprot:1057667-Rhodomonas_salina.1